MGRKTINNKFWRDALVSLGANHSSLYLDGYCSFYGGIWYDGTWINGDWWYHGIWLNGVWKAGIWHTIQVDLAGNRKQIDIYISPKSCEKPKMTLSLNYAKYN